jgi:hypothetical protein
MFEALFKGVSTRFGLQIVEKCLEKSAFHLLFLLPKSSFGEHNFQPSVEMGMKNVDVLIYVFHTHFDRGLKMRLFCSPVSCHAAHIASAITGLVMVT